MDIPSTVMAGLGPAIHGPAGIMLDDVVAALYALLLLLIGEGVFGVRP
jgi:phosphatidylglycerophosphatase A